MLIIIVAVVGLVALCGYVLIGNRPQPERFLAVNGLPVRPDDVAHVGAALRHTRRARAAGGAVGLLLGALGAWTLGTATAIGGAGIGLLGGSLLGIAVSQPRRRPKVAGERHASLTVRDPADYLPSRATVTTTVLALAVVGLTVVALALADAELGRLLAVFVIALGTIAAIPLGRVAQRRTVELARDSVDPTSVRVDDAVRANAVRSIHRATLGILFCGVLLAGYGMVASQLFQGVRVGDHLVVRTEPGSHDLRVRTGEVVPGAVRVDVTWTDADGHHRHRARTVTGASVTSGWLVDVGALVGLGWWAMVVGFVGAVVQWGRTAKSWRSPQRSPSAGAAEQTTGAGA